MKLSFENCRIHETERCKGPWVNTVTALYDGKKTILDRDTTEYTINPDGTCRMDWHGVYAWNGKIKDYNLIPSKCTLITDCEIEDDADEGYTFEIDPGNISIS